MKDDKLGEEAKTAQQEEMERKKRLQEKMQKLKEEQDKLETLKNTQLKSLLEGMLVYFYLFICYLFPYINLMHLSDPML